MVESAGARGADPGLRPLTDHEGGLERSGVVSVAAGRRLRPTAVVREPQEQARGPGRHVEGLDLAVLYLTVPYEEHLPQSWEEVEMVVDTREDDGLGSRVHRLAIVEEHSHHREPSAEIPVARD